MASSPPPEGAAREGDLGVLVVGIVIGCLGSVMHTFGQVPAAAHNVLMELGLMLFMAGVRLSAGGGAVEALASVRPRIVLSPSLSALPSLPHIFNELAIFRGRVGHYI